MRPSVRARSLQTLACAACALLLPASALAAGGSPVHIDPASPVAKEYALPLATARGAQPESGKSGKLFGSGIRHSSAGTRHTSHTPATPSPTPSQQPTPSEQPSTAATTETTTPAPAVQQSEQPATVTWTATTTTPARPRRPVHHRPLHVTTVTLPSLTRPIAPTRTSPATAPATPAAYRVLRPGSGSGLLLMALAAVVVVAVGSAGGFALSRRR